MFCRLVTKTCDTSIIFCSIPTRDYVDSHQSVYDRFTLHNRTHPKIFPFPCNTFLILKTYLIPEVNNHYIVINK